MSHFFAYMARMKYIRRWGLMRNTNNENIQEHSLQLSMIAHALGIIRNEMFGGYIDAERAAVLGMYHEASEVITGDLATPIKYFNPEIKTAYKQIEGIANNKLLSMLPEAVQSYYKPLLEPQPEDYELWQLVKAADRICAYLKCIEELTAGNGEFKKAAQSIKKDIEAMSLPEVTYFMDTFVPSFKLTLDEMG